MFFLRCPFWLKNFMLKHALRIRKSICAHIGMYNFFYIRTSISCREDSNYLHILAYALIRYLTIGVKRSKHKHFRFLLLHIQQRHSPSGRPQLERKKEAKRVLKTHRSSKKANAKYALTYKFHNSDLNELSTKLRISMR